MINAMPRRRIATTMFVTAIAVSSVNAAVAATIDGTPGDDVLTGTNRRDTIDGLAGNDTIRGLGQNDHLYGSAGNDTLYGDAGHDRIFGGLGADTMYGGFGPDILYTQGADHAFGGPQLDIIEISSPGAVVAHGGPSFDSLRNNGTGASLLYGDSGSDDFDAGPNASPSARYFGGTGEDVFFSLGDGGMQMFGGPGRDGFSSSQTGGGDEAFGGAGNDDFDFDFPLAPTPGTIHCGPGIDDVRADLTDTFDSDCENIVIAIAGDAGPNNITGTRYDDEIDGKAGNDVIHSLTGNDQIHGDIGRDLLYAGPGNDTLSDTISAVVNQFHCGAGHDTVFADSNDQVSADCEVVTRFNKR
jgi:Ca2+-binding RTX toxin-like protein